MKKVLSLAFPLLVIAASAQTNSPANPLNACGREEVSYKVTLSDDVSIPEPQSGMATVVFLGDQLRLRPGHPPCLHCANQMKLGMDGQWIAADAGISHTAISVVPGRHHFCALADPSLTASAEPSMYGMTLEAGKTYFLRGRLAFSEDGYVPVLDLSAVNEDEGRFMVATSKRSSFVLK